MGMSIFMFRSIIFLCLVFSISLPSLARQSCEWPFRTEIKIQENTGSGAALQNYQVKLNLNASSFSPDYTWSNNGEDLYIYDTDDETQLEFWIDSWNSSAKTATVWIRFPALARGRERLVYFYYGNKNAPALANVPFTFNYPGIKFHTRYSRTNPSSLTQAQNAFNASNDRRSNYGCGFITNFENITNRSQFGNADSNFAAFSESYFEVKEGETGRWEFRYGADFGRGGALYINGDELQQRWNRNLWWANNWNNANQILQGNATFTTSGYQKLEVLGFEDCCDGGITVQFKKPGGNWTTFSTNNIDIRSRACPVEREPTFTVGKHDVCEVDLAFDNAISYPNGWVVGDSRPVSFAIENLSTTHPSLPDTRVAVVLGAGLSLAKSSGLNWNCTTVTTGNNASPSELSCLYSAAIAANGGSSSLLTLNISTTNANTSANFSATVFSKQYEEQLVNNQISTSLPVWRLIDDIDPNCSTTPGVFARFYNSQGYSDNYADNKNQFDRWEADLAIREKLDGQTILSQINLNTGNPFDVRNSDYYLALLEGYLYAPEDGSYYFAVNGDDAVELQLNNAVISKRYGPNSAASTAQDRQEIKLAQGFHKLTYRMQEYSGQDAFYAYWYTPSDTNMRMNLIPSSAFFHCQGGADIQLSLSINILSSPDTSGAEHKAIPGAVLRYTLTGENKSVISSSPNSVIITQEVSSDLKMYILGLGEGSQGASPVAFFDGSGSKKSGLSFGTVSYSNNNGSSFNYIPSDDGEGYDGNITNYRVTLNGSMLPKDDSVNPETIPSFKLIHQVKVK